MRNRMIRIKPKQFWKGKLQVITVIDENQGIGASVTFDEEKILHVEQLDPEDDYGRSNRPAEQR
jgi:hypothetical protein